MSAFDRVKAWRVANPEKVAAQRVRWREKHAEELRAYRRARTASGVQRKAYAAMRLEVLARYGGRCRCCGEQTPEFLAIDHVGGTGAEHRKSDRTAKNIYYWLRKHGYPKKGFRVLCHNCNNAVGFYGRCPHLKRRYA
jgi:hypothetical protein